MPRPGIHPCITVSGCQKETERAPITCEAGPGIVCSESGNQTFTRDIPCKWTNGYDFDTALLLSIFLGFFGADRFVRMWNLWGELSDSNPWQEDSSRKLMGFNPCATKGFFLMKFQRCFPNRNTYLFLFSLLWTS